MVLSPLVAQRFEGQMTVLRQARQLCMTLVSDARQQLAYLDPNEGEIYALTYQLMRDGETTMHTINDLIWDVWVLYGELGRFSRRVYHRNGSSQ